MKVSTVSQQNINISLKGTLHRSARVIFENLSKDVPQGVGSYMDSSKKVYGESLLKKVESFVSKLSDEVEMYWGKEREKSFPFLKTYEGFMFRNKVTNKTLRASEYPPMSDMTSCYMDTPEEFLYEKNGGLRLQPPYIENPRPITVELRDNETTKLLDSMIDSTYDKTDCILIGGKVYYTGDRPLTRFVYKINKMFLQIIPKRIGREKYTEEQLWQTDRYVTQLTEKIDTKKLDSLLK